VLDKIKAFAGCLGMAFLGGVLIALVGLTIFFGG
jgi:prolipoprotein diacylglyceryltransferase